MKISDEMRYPHPVLSDTTGDFSSGEFDIELEIAEHKDLGTVALKYEIVLSQQEIKDLLEAGDAAAGIYVTCLETYYSDLIRLSLGATDLEFSPGKLSGRVVIRPLVWTVSEVNSFESEDVHDEFGEGPYSFPKASVLALGNERIISVGRDKLRELETIFSLARDQNLEGGTFSVDLEQEKITILIASDIYDLVNRLRGDAFGRSIVLNSIYLPAVMAVMSALEADPELFESRRWHPIFTAKCNFLGINIENPEIWTDAQTLLSTPFESVRLQAENLEF